MANATLTPEVEAILRASTVNGNVLVLPAGQLERKLYEAVNKVLVNCGGKWKRGTGHVFPSDPMIKLGLALDKGVAVDEKKERQAFYTPAAVAARVVELAEVSGCKVLEPSCGGGALIAECLAQGAAFIHADEIDPETAAVTQKRFADTGKVIVTCQDFLADRPQSVFDRCVMNPPYAKNAAFKHFVHALQFLKPDGLLVAVLPPLLPTNPRFLKATTGYNVKTEDVPEGAFKESGTNIRTVIVKITRDRA